MQMFAIRDRALGAFMRPWVAQTIGQAVRMFQDECDNTQGEINKHPDDYDLYHIGLFEDQTGKLQTTDQQPKLVATGAHYKLTPAQRAASDPSN